MITEQNKSLAAAAKTPKDTSSRHRESDKVSAKISSKKTSAKHQVAEKSINTSGKENAPIKGSYEGLQHSSGTLLNMDGAGYDKIELQKARYKDSSISHNTANFSGNNFNLNQNYSIMNNYSSVTQPGSSSSRISKFNKANSMF